MVTRLVELELKKIRLSPDVWHWQSETATICHLIPCLQYGRSHKHPRSLCPAGYHKEGSPWVYWLPSRAEQWAANKHDPLQSEIGWKNEDGRFPLILCPRFLPWSCYQCATKSGLNEFCFLFCLWKINSQLNGSFLPREMVQGWWQVIDRGSTAGVLQIDRSLSALLQGNRSLQRKSVCCAASRS